MRLLSELNCSCWSLVWRNWLRAIAAWGCIGLLMPIAPMPAQAQSAEPLILQQAYWQDASGQTTLDEVRRQTLTPYQGIFSRGYSDSAHWIRLTITHSEQPLGLRITPAWLDNITLYDPANPATPITVGDRHPAQRNALPGLGHSFTLPASTTTREVWLRLQTTSAHWLNAQVLPMDQIPQAGTRQIIWAALYTAVQLLILFVLLAIWWAQRDRVLGAYLLRHALYTWYGSAYLGLPTLLLSAWLPATVLDQAFSLSAVLMLPLSVYFDHAFLSGYTPRKHWLTLLKLVGLLGVGLVLLMLSGHTRLALQLNAYALMTGVTVMLLTALSCQSHPAVEQIMPKKVMVTYYALIFSSLLIGIANVLGWFEPREWTLYALNLHGLVSGLMMTAILFVRAQRMVRQSQQVSWQLQKAQQDMAQEQRHRQEQSQFLHMLTHELKTPLGVARISLGASRMTGPQRDRIERALSNINAIVDRCRITDLLEHQQLLPHTESCELMDLVGDCIAACSTPERVKALERNPIQVQSDSQLLAICLANLIDNALKYSPPASMVEVQVQPQPAAPGTATVGAQLIVRNTIGPAGSPDPAQLFSKYYRSPGALSKSGSGLGLYLTRSIAQLLGARLSFSADANQVEFCLWIPN